MRRAYPTQRERTEQAFWLYLELLATADWLQGWMLGSLEGWGLSLRGLRLLMLLERDGEVSRPEASQAVGCSRQGMDDIARELEASGWLEREVRELPAAKVRASRVPKAMRGKPRVGRRIGMLRLTAAGRKFIGHVLPKHAKWVKATMRVLDYREQGMLERLCRKLREGDVMKTLRELRYED